MEEIKEKSAKKPVSMRLTATASERLMHIIDLYKIWKTQKASSRRMLFCAFLILQSPQYQRDTS